MIGVLCLLKVKFIVVFSCKNDLFYVSCFYSFVLLVGIQIFEVENLWIFYVCFLFYLGKGIGAKVNKGDEFIVQSSVLIGCRYYMGSFQKDGIWCIIGVNFDSVCSGY